MADLSKLSNADLQALQAGNIAAVSTEGLRALRGAPAAVAAETPEQVRARRSAELQAGQVMSGADVKAKFRAGELTREQAAAELEKSGSSADILDTKLEDLPGMQRLMGGAQQLAAGATFNFGDEIAAGIAAPVAAGLSQFTDAPMNVREAYGASLEDIRGRSADFAEAAPVTSGALNVAGALANPINRRLFGGAPVSKALTVGGATRNALAGGGAAALYGAGSSEGGVGERVQAGLEDVPVGVVTGLLLPAGLSAATKGAQSTARGAQIATRAISGAKPQQVIEEVVGRSRLSLEQIRQQIASGQISTIADVAGDEVQGLTRALGKIEGGRNIVVDALEGRSEQAVNRIVGQLTKSVSNVDAYFGNIDDVVAARSKMAAPLYNEAYNANQTIQSKVVDSILDTPTGKRALAEASRKMQDQMARMGAPDAALTRQARAMGQAAEGGVARGLNLQSLDYVKRSFDDMIGMAKRSGAMDEVRSLSQTKNALLSELDKADKTGKYALARKVFSDQTAIKEAQEAGLQFKNLTPEQLQRTLKGMEPAEREAFRIGVRERLQREVLNTPDKADAAKRIFGNPTERQQLEAILGKGKQFDEFADRMKEEIRAADTKFKLLGGSRTDINLAAESQLEGVMGRVARGDIKGAMIDRAAEFIGNTLRQRYYGLNEKNAQEIARALVDRKAGLEALDKIISKQGGDQRGIVQEAVNAMRSFAVQNANPATPTSATTSAARNSQRGALSSVNAPLATAAVGLGAANFASSLAVPTTGPAQDEWANQPRDVQMANEQAKRMDEVEQYQMRRGQDLSQVPTEVLQQQLEQIRMAPVMAPTPVSTSFLISEEGFRPTAYKDSLGITTIGYGFNLEQPNARDVIKRVKIPESYEGLRSGREVLSQESARKLFDYKHRKSEAAAASIVPNFSNLGENQRAALTSMAYHMGGAGLRKFQKTLKYLQQGNAKAVENQLLSSLMAEQTPARARRTALMLAYDLSPEEAEARLVEQGRISAQERKYL